MVTAKQFAVGVEYGLINVSEPWLNTLEENLAGFSPSKFVITTTILRTVDTASVSYCTISGATVEPIDQRIHCGLLTLVGATFYWCI